MPNADDASAAPRRGPGGPPRQGRSGASGGRGPGDAGRGNPRTDGAGDGARRGATREQIGQRTYDPRREERRRAMRVALPDDVDPRMLDADARRDLRGLSKETADLVARHLVMTGHLLDEDPAQALAHARAARALGARIGVVREAAGLAAYAAGEWAEALSELRAARRITGSPEHLPVLADCERALGRPERALAYARDPQLSQLTQDQRVELVIVLAGARRDLGQADAAVLELQDPARRTTERRPWAARLWYAYAEALLEAGRKQDARTWFGKAATVDVDGRTDAGDRLLALDGFVLDEPLDDELEERADLPTADELAELVRQIRPTPAADAAAEPAEPDAVQDVSGVGVGPAAPALPRSGVSPPPFAEPEPDSPHGSG